LDSILQIIEYVVLFAYIVLASMGWGALCCERMKLPARFLFMLGFGVLAFLAYLASFVFLLNAVVGRIACGLVGLASLGVTARQWTHPGAKASMLQVDVWLPILLLFFYTASCLLVLLLHGGDPSHAVSHQLPPDNILPRMLADRLWNGASVNPFYEDWLSSDRPPLQAALYLLCRPFEFLKFKTEDIYPITSILFQTTWLPALYLLARGLHFSRFAMGFMLVWFAGSGFFLVHSIYTWPKLLSASLFLGGLSILLFCAKNLPKKYPAALLGLSLLWALSLLSHGGILFSFLAVPLLPSAWRLAAAQPRAILGALAVFILMSLPWAAYQKFYDPPGNRLIKWHLGGAIPIDSRSSGETLRDSYGTLTFHQWLQNRRGNLQVSLFLDRPQADTFQSVAGLQYYLTSEGFFRITAVLGLLNIGFVVLVASCLMKKHRGPPDGSACGELLLMNIGCYLIWIVLMFRPDSAIVHQGSYAMIILFMMIAALGITKLPPWISLSLLACQWTFFTFAYLYYFPVPVIMDATGFINQGLYWILTLLFSLSVWAFLPRTSND